MKLQSQDGDSKDQKKMWETQRYFILDRTPQSDSDHVRDPKESRQHSMQSYDVHLPNPLLCRQNLQLGISL